MCSENIVSFLIEFWISLLNNKKKSQSLRFDYRYIRVRLWWEKEGNIPLLGGGGGGYGKWHWSSNAPKIEVRFVASVELPSETKA